MEGGRVKQRGRMGEKKEDKKMREGGGGRGKEERYGGGGREEGHLHGDFKKPHRM